MMEDEAVDDPSISNPALVAYRLGRVEKAVEHTNSRLDMIMTLSTKLEAHSIRLDSLEAWKKNVVAYLVALSLLVIGSLLGMAIR